MEETAGEEKEGREFEHVLISRSLEPKLINKKN
jgi:hypothetical protein